MGRNFHEFFAEIILQAIDREVANKLKAGVKSLQNWIDYEIFRYVDDYFIFFNDDKDRTLIVDELQHTLKKYKLYLNAAKAIVYEKPIITEITMAKQQISRLLEDRIKFQVEKIKDDEGDVLTKGSIHVNSNALITSFKTIIKTCQVEYRDMLNYTLSIIERMCEKIMVAYLKVTSEYRPQMQLVSAIKGILDFIFFVYSVSPRVNTTIRLCRILGLINSFVKSGHIINEQAQLVHKQIYDDVCFILKKNESSEQIQVETLYLLLALSELGRDYWLEESILREYLGIKSGPDEKVAGTGKALSYFSITVSLLYMRDKVRYSKLRDEVVNTALDRISTRSQTCHKEAELVFLLFDLISCPYVYEAKKYEALAGFGVTDVALAKDIIEFTSVAGESQLWFTSWLNFDFGKELVAKRSQEVY